MDKIILGLLLGAMYGWLCFNYNYEHNVTLDIWQPRKTHYVYQRAQLEIATPTR